MPWKGREQVRNQRSGNLGNDAEMKVSHLLRVHEAVMVDVLVVQAEAAHPSHLVVTGLVEALAHHQHGVVDDVGGALGHGVHAHDVDDGDDALQAEPPSAQQMVRLVPGAEPPLPPPRLGQDQEEVHTGSRLDFCSLLHGLLPRQPESAQTRVRAEVSRAYLQDGHDDAADHEGQVEPPAPDKVGLGEAGEEEGQPADEDDGGHGDHGGFG